MKSILDVQLEKFPYSLEDIKENNVLHYITVNKKNMKVEKIRIKEVHSDKIILEYPIVGDRIEIYLFELGDPIFHTDNWDDVRGFLLVLSRDLEKAEKLMNNAYEKIVDERLNLELQKVRAKRKEFEKQMRQTPFWLSIAVVLIMAIIIMVYN